MLQKLSHNNVFYLSQPFSNQWNFPKATYDKVRMVYCIYLGNQYICLTCPFPKTVFCSLKISFVLANSADPDEILQNAAFLSGSSPCNKLAV